MAALTTALIAGTALMGGAQVYGAKKQATAARNASRAAQEEQRQLLAAAERQRQRESITRDAMAQRARQAGDLLRGLGGDGRASTILTGAAGLGGSATTQRATLLGL